MLEIPDGPLLRLGCRHPIEDNLFEKLMGKLEIASAMGPVGGGVPANAFALLG